MSTLRYSDKLKAALEEVRPGFKDIGASVELITRKRKDLAPAFHRAWTLWQRETHRPFVAFAQALDPSIPAERAGYRKHASYQAACDLLDLVRKPEETTRRGLTPLAMLAVTVKSMMPLFKSERERQDAIRILLGASKWSAKEQTRLVAAIGRAKAVGLPNAPRLVDVNKMTKAVVVAFERERIPA